MSAKYQKPFVIPDGFPELLKSFTREILRSQVRRDTAGILKDSRAAPLRLIHTYQPFEDLSVTSHASTPCSPKTSMTLAPSILRSCSPPRPRPSLHRPPQPPQQQRTIPWASGRWPPPSMSRASPRQSWSQSCCVSGGQGMHAWPHGRGGAVSKCCVSGGHAWAGGDLYRAA